MGIVFDIKRFSLKDGPGIRSTIFLKGCPLRCQWCHNPESWDLEPLCNGSEVIGREMSVEEVMAEVLPDKIFYQKSSGGITLSGGEPMMQFKFTKEILLAAKSNNVMTALDTCGYCSWSFYEELLPLVDLFLYDYKVTDSVKHLQLTGVENSLIKNNLHKLSQNGARIFLRCPLIPELNDEITHLNTIAFLAETLSGIEEITIEPYHPLGTEKATRLGFSNILKDKSFTPKAIAKKWQEIISSQTSKKVIISA